MCSERLLDLRLESMQLGFLQLEVIMLGVYLGVQRTEPASSSVGLSGSAACKASPNLLV